MGSPVVHWELWSKDPQGAADFYEKVFDWKIQHHPELQYRSVDTGAGAGINGGIFQPDKSGPWPGPLAFSIDVDDLDEYAKKIEAAGGKILVSKQEVPGMGWFSLFADPDERVLGIWKTNR